MSGLVLARAVFYKEAVKLRLPWLILLLFNAAFMAWMFVDVRHLFRLDHPEVVWYRVIGLGQIHYASIRFIPLLSGLFFACLQFLPEMRDERLRLSLHLPVSSNSVILAHLAYGLLVLGALYLSNAVFLIWLTLFYFPYNVAQSMLLTFTPWLLAGFIGYLGVTLALLEPRVKLRVFNLLLTAGLSHPLYANVPPGACSPVLPWFAAVPLLLLLAALLPGYHFRHRRTEA